MTELKPGAYFKKLKLIELLVAIIKKELKTFEATVHCTRKLNELSISFNKSTQIDGGFTVSNLFMSFRFSPSTQS